MCVVKCDGFDCTDITVTWSPDLDHVVCEGHLLLVLVQLQASVDLLLQSLQGRLLVSLRQLQDEK